MEEKEAILNDGCVGILPAENVTYRFYLRGELDHHSVKQMREIIDGALIDYRPKEVILDLGEVTFTDSAGLGLVLGRYTRVSGYGGKLSLVNVSSEFRKILHLAGTDRILPIEGRPKDKPTPV